MPYDIFGFVEVAPPGDGPWLAAFRVEDIVGSPCDFSREAFGLDRWSIKNQAFAHRGLPENASVDVIDSMSTSWAEAQENGERDPYEDDHTFATWAALKRMPPPEDESWQTLFATIAELQREGDYADTQIRVVLWSNL